jgi:hypothetical protein
MGPPSALKRWNTAASIPKSRGIRASNWCRARNLDGHFTIIGHQDTEASMNGLIYLVGLVVIILAVLSFFGLR